MQVEKSYFYLLVNNLYKTRKYFSISEEISFRNIIYFSISEISFLSDPVLTPNKENLFSECSLADSMLIYFSAN